MNGVATSAVMRNFLVISDSLSQPDQASGDLRFFTLLSYLVRKCRLLFCALNTNGTTQPRSDASMWLACHACLTHFMRYFGDYPTAVAIKNHGK